MKQTLFLILLIIFSSASFSQKKLNKKIVQEEKSITINTCEIKGTVLLPKKIKGKIPIVIIIAGSGPTDRDGNSPTMKNNSLKTMAEELCLNGTASFRYDKRMIAKSIDTTIKEIDLRFETYINDAVEIVNYIKKDQRFSSVIIAGHSEGSLIGMIAAQQTKPDKYISLAGVGVSADEILKKQLVNKKLIKDEAFTVIDSLKKGIQVDSLSDNLQAIFRPSVQPYLISWFKYNPQTEIAKLKIPILIVQGTTDIQVDSTNAELLHKASLGSELHIIKEMNHVLKQCSDNYTENLKTYFTPEIPLNSELIGILVKFINQ